MSELLSSVITMVHREPNHIAMPLSSASFYCKLFPSNTFEGVVCKRTCEFFDVGIEEEEALRMSQFCLCGISRPFRAPLPEKVRLCVFQPL